MSDVEVWADPEPTELAGHLVRHHGYPADQVPEKPEQARLQHAADHKFCWGIKGAKSDSVDQVFLRHTHPPKGKARV